ncbi:hypothetical protein CRM22_003519 [Opisthorchis felineus]|uniref:Uncharacterized protein n=1 Tax=Opisthorchis felineus TaxID=147828 RepID=A0A4S2M6W4_OPIFE|nr:hypothetical protein CRM22_003519 [Opisthorchis felineus]
MCEKVTSHLLFILTALMLVVGGVIMIFGGMTVWGPVYVKVQTNLWKQDNSLESHQESYERIVQLLQSVTRPLGIVFMVFGFILSITAVLGCVGICHLPVMTFVYAILVGVAVLIHIILVTVYFSNKEVFLSQGYATVQNLVRKYTSLESNNKDSWTLGLFMSMIFDTQFHAVRSTKLDKMLTAAHKYSTVRTAMLKLAASQNFTKQRCLW